MKKKVVLVGINERKVNCLPIYLLKSYVCLSGDIRKNFEFILFDIYKNDLKQEITLSEILKIQQNIVGF